MDKPQYYTLEELLEMIDIPQRSVCQQILVDNRKLFAIAKGSSHNHQAWTGGYWDHVVEVMNLAILLYPTLDSARRLQSYGGNGFSLSEALVVLFLHDIEKPWKYTLKDGVLLDNPALADKAARKAFRDFKISEYEIELSDQQQNAMRYVEGEFDDYSNERRAMWPLAAFCHSCDVLSARLWPEFPRGDDDWTGATRINGSTPLSWNLCRNCGSDKELVAKNVDDMTRDADLHCRVCGGFVRERDAS